MLDTQTKSKIDSARDILVGKVPDPKSQVEQITIALIYKFMDDMDRQSEELGGKVTFFTGEFKKYRWANLLDKRLGGHERLGLYSEGLDKMNTNKNIPQLFRDIFKGVFLPYRDPETLNLFLKEIGSFNYDHSERLGDAYEYLLNILGTQGDAGQFRTPRHIIDFIVAVVDPQKNETVLDPACGTAGFLISAFKHILKTNENLTPDERARLMTNFRGYDIAPDMVRLSRVNMYLHSFPNPVIHEYDALTSEERWDERCDVILANPPFMTPKGGIRPHNRFSIKAKRSEVLFVDYMAEHLNPGGRAGIIVPEGIIFQSQNAYKALRKMLVENYLWAVVSLPAGVFNPYSGVKTSILFLDRNLARRTDELLFVKVESDGFDLGAQRRPIEKNDLPAALSAILDFRLRIGDLKKESSDNQKSEIQNQKSVTAHTVLKSKILASGDANLSGDRYRDTGVRISTKWPLARLGEVCEFQYGSSLPERRRVWGPYPVVGSNGVTGFHNEFIAKGPAIVVGRKGSAGEVVWIDNDCYPIDTTYYVTLRPSDVSLRYLYYILKHINLPSLRDGAGVPGLNRNDAYGVQIPLPPLEVQEKIVEELDGYRKIIEGAKQVIGNYKPTIRIDSKWPIDELKTACDLFGGFAFKSSDLTTKPISEQYLPVIKIGNVEKSGTLSSNDIEYHRYTDDLSRFLISKGDILVAMTGATVGKVAISKQENLLLNQRVGLIRAKGDVALQGYLGCLLLSKDFYDYCQVTAGGGAQGNISPSQILRYSIQLPPLDVQRQIVEEIEAERELVEANRKLIGIYELKIQAKLAEIWGEAETANG